MNFKSLAIALSVAAASLLQAEFINKPDANTLWSEDGKNIAISDNPSKGWRSKDFLIGANPSGGFHFAGSDAIKDKSTGRYVKTDKAYPYLVMDIASTEYKKGYIALNSPVGMLQMSKLEPGYFVIDLYNAPDGKVRTFNSTQYFAFYLYNAKVNFNTIKLVKSPDYFISTEVTGNKGDDISGATLKFTVRLKNPADSVSLQFVDNRGVKPLIVNGEKNFALKAVDAGRKLWSGEVKDFSSGSDVKAGNLLLKAIPVGKDLPVAVWSTTNFKISPAKKAAPVAVAAKKKITTEALPKGSHGPYGLEAAVFYIDHSGGDLRLDIAASHPGAVFSPDSRDGIIPSLLGTLYDPQEKAVRDIYWRDEKNEKERKFTINIPGAAKGIWEFRVAVSKGRNMKYAVKISPDSRFGLLPNRCWIWHKDLLNFPETYFYVPQDNKQELDFFAKDAKIEISELTGKIIAVADKNGKKTKLIPGHTYRMRIKSYNPNWSWIGLSGFPVILCPTPELAQKLKGGRVELSDGTLAPLKFQQRAEAWKKTLTRADLEVPVADLSKYEKELIADPRGASALLGITGPLAGAKFLLESQNIDLKSPDFGSGPYFLGAMAVLYSVDRPYNPYYKNKALANRIALYFINLMAKQFPLHENGTLYEIGSNYAGADAMYSHQDSDAFMLVAPDLPPQVRELWGEAIAYPLRRFYSDRVSCANQSAHWPMKLYGYYRGSGNELFKQLAEDYVKDLGNVDQDRFIRTGYLQESYGTDATYQGLCTSVLAFYYRESCDDNAGKILKRIYNLLNHTVVRDPDGRIYGASGFAHRTMGGWYIKQYGGGTRMMADTLPEAAAWHRSPDQLMSADEIRRQITWSKSADAAALFKSKPYLQTRYAFSPFSASWYTFPKYVEPLTDGKFPAESQAKFDHEFNGEYSFFRRDGYYSGIYTGNTASRHVSWGGNKTPFGCKWEEKNGVWSPTKRAIFGALQGLQLFSADGYGAALVSMNWTLYTHQTARLDKQNGACDWISYWDTVSYGKNGKVTLEQKFRSTPLTLTRIFTHGDKSLSVALNFVTENPTNDSVIEQFPYVIKGNCHVTLEPKNGHTKVIRLENAAKRGVKITFYRPVEVRFGKTYLDQNVKIGTIDAVLGKMDGKTLNFNYTIEGF